MLERGSKRPVPDIEVAIGFTGADIDSSLPLPLPLYLEKIGLFDGQQYSDGVLSTWTDSAGYFSFKSLPSEPLSIK